MAIKNELEQWKTVNLKLQFNYDFKLQISNLGNVRTYNKVNNGTNLKCSTTNGYKAIKLKLFKPRSPEVAEVIDGYKNKIIKINKKIIKLQLEKNTKKEIKELNIKLAAVRLQLKNSSAADLKERGIYYSALVHRLVATYFIKDKNKDQNIVGHKNFNKLDNRASNLKWMNIKECTKHQQKSPIVIKSKQDRKDGLLNIKATNTKLSLQKVATIKKLLNNGSTLIALQKRYQVSSTQIARIKSGENWSSVAMAD